MTLHDEKRALSLIELNGLVRSTIEGTLTEEYWVEAELAEARESRGHCYMELVQKDPRSATPVAKAPAKCWRQTWALLRPYFERTTGQTLHAGVLGFVHPRTGEYMEFSAPLPDYFSHLLKILG